jgi:hypothetical protein
MESCIAAVENTRPRNVIEEYVAGNKAVSRGRMWYSGKK